MRKKKLRKKKRKSTKPHISWLEIMVSGLVDLIIGVILVLLGKLIE